MWLSELYGKQLSIAGHVIIGIGGLQNLQKVLVKQKIGKLLKVRDILNQLGKVD